MKASPICRNAANAQFTSYAMKSPAEQYAALLSPSGCPPQSTSPSRSYAITRATGRKSSREALNSSCQYRCATRVASSMSALNSSGVSVPSGSSPAALVRVVAGGAGRAAPPGSSAGADTQPIVTSAASAATRIIGWVRRGTGMRILRGQA
jgi:hypothetical protein